MGGGAGFSVPGKGRKKGFLLRDFSFSTFWIIGISYLFTSASFYAIFTFIVMYGVMEIGSAIPSPQGL